MRVAVTGSTGRLGRALVAALADAPFTGPAGPTAWTRADLDLDAPDGVTAALDRDRPEVVVHSAAWTDVDGCARDPELAREAARSFRTEAGPPGIGWEAALHFERATQMWSQRRRDEA